MGKPAYERLLEGLAPCVADVPQFQGALAEVSAFGNVWYVDSVNGSDTANDGSSRDKAFATIAVAVAAAAAGDTIYIKGSFSEAVTVNLAGLRIIGWGTTPKEAQWTADADADCVTVTAQHVVLENIYFRPPAYSADRTTTAIKLSGAHYLRVRGCRFQGKTGSQAAIYSAAADSDNVEISDCEFQYMNTATYGFGIRGINAGGVSYSGWRILNNTFVHCVNAIKLSCRGAILAGNTIVEYGVNPAGAVAQLLALGIDLSGDDATNSGANALWCNQLGGTYNATLYKKGAAGDQWGGNFNVITGGVTAANPT